VLCKTPNTSPVTSVSFWYLIDTAPWAGDYAPSDSFRNHKPPGATDVDPAVPDCW
jgi:hypothetical protein